MTVENRNNAQEPLLQVRGLSLRFPVKQGLLDILMRRPQQAVTAVDDVDLAIYPGECLGLVGESGCGKSTLAKTIIRIYDPDAGTVLLDGVDFTALKGKRLQAARRSVQMVFQDPYSSLNPRMSVGAMLKEVLQVHHVCPKDEMDARVAALLEMVGLAPDAAQRSPGEFSGGQRQRIGIARTLALQPKLLIADEAVSALDVSVQAQIINLLEELQKSLHLTMLFISHDLSVVRCMTDRAVVMYLGKIMEMGPTEHLFGAPAHPYTRNLIDAGSRLSAQREHDDRRAAQPHGYPRRMPVPSALSLCKKRVPPRSARTHGPGRRTFCGLPFSLCVRRGAADGS